MQLLNKGYIIKAAHSTRCTIAVLDRGMDYSEHKRGVGWGWGIFGTIRKWLRKASMRGNDDTGCSGLLISMHFLRIRFCKTTALCAFALQLYLFKKLSTLLSLRLCQSLCVADFVSVQNNPIIKCKNWFLITMFISLELDGNFLFEMTDTWYPKGH